MRDLPVDQGVTGEFPDLVLRMFIDIHLLKLFFLDLDGVALKKNIKDRAFLAPDHPLHRTQDSGGYCDFTV